MRQMAGRKRRKRRMHRQRIRGIYTLLLIMAAGGILIYSGQAGSGKKTEEYPAVSWIEAQEKENVKAIEAKLAAKERRAAWKAWAMGDILPSASAALAGAALWVCLEWGRGWLIPGFGWNNLGVALYLSLIHI